MPAGCARTTRIISATCSRRLRRRRAPTAGCSRWPTAWADSEQGEVASRAAVESVLAGFRARRRANRITPCCTRLVQAANARVFETGCALRPPRRRHGNHSGGLRPALRPRHGGARRRFALLPDPPRPRPPLTRDHTVAGEQVRLGMLSAEEAARLPPATCSAARWAANFSSTSRSTKSQFLPGDVLVLCSDGLHGARDRCRHRRDHRDATAT